MRKQPLADRIRPMSFDEMVGQSHLFGEKGTVRKLCEGETLPNMIFYGPPGTGKTTAAGIIARSSGMTLRKLNATTASLADVKEVIAETGTLLGSEGILLYLDEIQYFNKKQQQSLLEYIEDGRITLVASTTENPYLYVYAAILSRSAVFEFRPVTAEEAIPALKRGLKTLNEETGREKTASEEVLKAVAEAAAGESTMKLSTRAGTAAGSAAAMAPAVHWAGGRCPQAAARLKILAWGITIHQAAQLLPAAEADGSAGTVG